MSKILIIEDEPRMVEALGDAFEHHGFEVCSSFDGEEGLKLALSGTPDLIVLDLMLPKKDGIEVCRDLRAKGINTPIIMLTARSEEPDRVAGLELGADDYVTKPFSVRELVARVKAILRRAGGPEKTGDQVQIGKVTVDLKKYVVHREGFELPLTDHEARLLRYFLAHSEEVIPRDRLLDEIWGYDSYPTTRTVDTFIYRLRQKIEADPQKPRHLVTVHGVGYRFEL